MPKTYEPIATTTVGSAVAGVTFSSITSAYTDLILIYDGTNTNSDSGLVVRLNSDTATNYSTTQLNGYSSGASSARTSNSSGVDIFFGTTDRTTGIAHFMNYSNTTTNKTILARTGVGASPGATRAAAILWRSTSAISTIYIYRPDTTIASGSTFTLYGIKAA